MPVQIVSIEGNIGAGKSRIFNKLSKRFEKDTRVAFVEEPVDEWLRCRDDEGRSILDRYYESPATHSFKFQMLACISRLQRIEKAIRSGAEYVITERCLSTDRHVFAEMLRKDGLLTAWEFKIYKRWFEHFSATLPPHTHIYLSVPAEVCSNRIATRGREGEAVPAEYLRRCGAAHDEWLRSLPNCLIIDGNPDTAEDEDGVAMCTCLEHLSSLGLSDPSKADLVVRFDGAARGNPGPSGWGFWAKLADDQLLAECGRLPGSATNNEAEYEACASALEATESLLSQWRDTPLWASLGSIRIEGDSMLVVRQVSEQWQCRASNLQAICARCRMCLARVKELAGRKPVSLVHIPRAENVEADGLANRGIGVA